MIDSGDKAGPIVDYIREASLSLKAILISHAHFDHVEGALEVKEALGSPLYMHAADKKLLSRMNLFRALFDKEKPVLIPEVDFDLSSVSELNFDGLSFGVIHTPGHTQGGVCFRHETGLFTGDTLMRWKFGRTDLPGGDHEALQRSIADLSGFPGDTMVYPGHGKIFSLREILRENGGPTR